jgi:hypothetical protein
MRGTERKKKCFLIAASLWAGGLVFLALLPESVVMFILRKRFLFPVAHVVAYVILGFLLCLRLRFQRVFFSYRMDGWRLVLFTVGMAACWGGITEAVQIFSLDRGPDVVDLQWDLVGTAIGIFFFFLFSKGFLFLKTMKSSLAPHPHLETDTV